VQEFHPELIARRGELYSWLSAVAVLVVLMILNQTQYIIPGWTWFFFGFLAFSAFAISLGNWVDRKTQIQLERDGIRFENGLRSVRLSWHEIQRLAVLPARWGKSVQVLGEKSGFGFKTLGEVQFQGKVLGQTGFSEGQEILDTILREANLVLIEESNNAYYYTRN
jgi:hypothetical protein